MTTSDVSCIFAVAVSALAFWRSGAQVRQDYFAKAEREQAALQDLLLACSRLIKAIPFERGAALATQGLSNESHGDGRSEELTALNKQVDALYYRLINESLPGGIFDTLIAKKAYTNLAAMRPEVESVARAIYAYRGSQNLMRQGLQLVPQ